MTSPVSLVGDPSWSRQHGAPQASVGPLAIPVEADGSPVSSTRTSGAHRIAAHRVRGRAVVSRLLGTAFSGLASYRDVAAALNTTASTIGAWCDPRDLQGPQIGDLLALASSGRPDVARAVMVAALAAIDAIESAQPKATIAPETHALLIVASVGRAASAIHTAL